MSQSTDNEGSLSPERSEGHRQLPRRSGSSFFGAIKSLVAAPLSWLNGDQSRDIGEKRSLPTIGEVVDDRATKKQRRLTQTHGERNVSGSSFDEARNGISKLSFQQTNELTPIPEPPPASLSRSSPVFMNVDVGEAGPSTVIQSSRHSHQWSSSNGFRSLSQDITTGLTPLSQRHSVSRVATPSTSYRMRKSLTPQPVTPLSPSKRDFSISRSSFMWPVSSRASISPVREFRQEASAPVHRKQLIWDETLGITTKEELEESSRASTPVPSTQAERALQALNAFRKPLIPPSFANDPGAYSYLKGGRKYAPPPLPPSILESGLVTQSHFIDNEKASLSAKTARMVRPYNGEGGVKKLLKKRASERQINEDRGKSVKETAIQTVDSNLGGHSISTMGSDKKDKIFSPNPPLSQDAFSKTSALGGRISGSRSTAPSRAANPNAPGISSLRAEKISRRPHEPSARKNKFAVPDDYEDDGIEPHLLGLPTEQELLNGDVVPFEVPSGFSFRFAKLTESIQSKATAESKQVEEAKSKPPEGAHDPKLMDNTVSRVSSKEDEVQTVHSQTNTIPDKNPPEAVIEVENPPAPSSSLHFAPITTISDTKGTQNPLDTLSLSSSEAPQTESPTPIFGSYSGDTESTPLFASTKDNAGGATANKTANGPTTSLPFPLFNTLPPAPMSLPPRPPAPFDVEQPDSTASDITGKLASSLTTPITPVAPTSFSFNSLQPASGSGSKKNEPEGIAVKPSEQPSFAQESASPSLIVQAPECTNKPTFSFLTPSSASFAQSENVINDKPSSQIVPPPKISFGGQMDVNKLPFSFTSSPASQPSGAEKEKTILSGFSIDSASPNSTPFVFEKPEQPRVKTPEPMSMSDRMEESPTRDANVTTKAAFGFGATPSTTADTPFSFGTASSSNARASIPFSFGTVPQATQPSIPFSAPSESNRPSSSGSTSGTPFAFSSNANTAQPPSAATAAIPFTFGATASKSTEDNRASSPFTFGASIPSNPFINAVPSSNPFSSPLQPPQPLQNESRGTTPFGFNSPTLAPSNPFSFGASKPSSPTLGTVSLPTASPATSSNAIFQFGAGTQPPQPQGEPNLFTIGSAPPITPQGRVTKGLPKRRPATRR